MEPVCIGLDKDQRPIKRISSKTLLNEMTQVFERDENIHSVTLVKTKPVKTKPVESGNTSFTTWTMDKLVCGC